MALVYLVDTNTISEFEQLEPDRAVVNQLQEKRGQIALSSISLHELLYGFHRLPESRRKNRVGYFIQQTVKSNLPILPYDSGAAEWFAEERARLSLVGQTPSYADGQIAAIAATNNLILVTRNTADFINFSNLQVENWFK